MKKMISTLLALCSIFGLCACGGTSTPKSTDPSTHPQAPVLKAGYGRENISPDFPVGMRGYSDSETRKTGAVLDNIYTTCVAFSDGAQTILLYTIDMCAMSEEWIGKIREYVSAFIDIPGENIYIGVTHTHSAPDVNEETQWDTMLLNGCLNAAQSAIADLAPIQLETATATLENMNFVRHYLMNDGTYYGSNFGSMESGFKAHAIEYPDRQLILLKLNREDKQDILMVNWQAHPAAAARQSEYNGISADFIGHTRAKLENETGMAIAYYTGALGNINPRSLIESENTNNNESYIEYGKTLADKIIATLPNLTPVENGGIQTTKLSYEAKIDHSWDHLLTEANEVYDIWKTVSKKEGDKLAVKYGMSSVYHANAIRNRAKLPESEMRELSAFRVGPIGFAALTYQMFSDNAEYVKQNSPFDITFILSSNWDYIGNKSSFEYRSYETDISNIAAGTGEILAEEYAKLLNSLE